MMFDVSLAQINFMLMRFFIFLSLVLFSMTLRSQDTLLLMNGRELGCHIVSDSGTVFLFELAKKNGKIKLREIHKNEVFSVTKSGEEEMILYTKNEFLGDVYSTEEMRYYLAGENDARSNFTAWPTFIVGFALCGTIGFLGQDGFMTALFPPLLYTVAQLVPKIKIRESTMSHPDYKYNDMYADGYEPPARSRKLFRALEGSFAGSAAGVLAWLVLVKN
jgi:hypothetical protein